MDRGGNALLSALLVCVLSGPASSQSISPEALVAALAAGEQLLLVDAGRLPPAPLHELAAGRRIILFDPGLTHRSAHRLAEQMRESGKADVLWLAGSLPQWRRLALPDIGAASPRAIDGVAPADLASLLRDQVPLQLIDLRPSEAVQRSRIEGSTARLPHELTADASSVRRDRWVVLIDERGTVGAQVADLLRNAGRSWVTHLEGGYSAWLKWSGAQ